MSCLHIFSFVQLTANFTEKHILNSLQNILYLLTEYDAQSSSNLKVRDTLYCMLEKHVLSEKRTKQWWEGGREVGGGGILGGSVTFPPFTIIATNSTTTAGAAATTTATSTTTT